MTTPGYAIFETALGPAAVAWGPAGVTGSTLPCRDRLEAAAIMNRRHGEAIEADPSPDAARAIDGIRRLVAGEPDAMADIVLDYAGIAEFNRAVYDVARAIPPGQTLTYGEVARRIGFPHAAQAVGQALGRNPFAPIVPCHRVLAAGNRSGGFSAPGGTATKLKLLRIEGWTGGDQPDLFGHVGFRG